MRYKSEPRALTRREIAAIVQGYARAAGLALQGGLDGVEVSIAHGYLAAQFFSPRTNHRADEYAGALEGRMRFALEILEAIRAEVGGALALGVRLAANEMAPDTAGRDECAVIADRLRAGGLVDFVSMALGHSSSYAGSVHIARPRPPPRTPSRRNSRRCAVRPASRSSRPLGSSTPPTRRRSSPAGRPTRSG